MNSLQTWDRLKFVQINYLANICKWSLSNNGSKFVEIFQNTSQKLKFLLVIEYLFWNCVFLCMFCVLWIFVWLLKVFFKNVCETQKYILCTGNILFIIHILCLLILIIISSIKKIQSSNEGAKIYHVTTSKQCFPSLI